MNLPAEGWACSAVLLRGAHTRPDIKLFQEVISLLFFTEMPNALDLVALVRAAMSPRVRRASAADKEGERLNTREMAEKNK